MKDRKHKIVEKSKQPACTSIVEEKKRSPWEICQSLQPIGGSGHGKRVAKSKEILKKKFEGMRKKWTA
jgi:hypothetical protein